MKELISRANLDIRLVGACFGVCAHFLLSFFFFCFFLKRRNCLRLIHFRPIRCRKTNGYGQTSPNHKFAHFFAFARLVGTFGISHSLAGSVSLENERTNPCLNVLGSVTNTIYDERQPRHENDRFRFDRPGESGLTTSSIIQTLSNSMQAVCRKIKTHFDRFESNSNLIFHFEPLTFMTIYVRTHIT